MSENRFKKTRENKAEKIQTFEDKFAYADMKTRVEELANASNWEYKEAKGDEPEVNEFEDFSDAVIEMARIDDLSAEDAELVNGLYEDLKEKSGLSDIEIKEFETYTKRMARYESLIAPIEDLTAQILDGESIDEDKMLAEKLNHAIQGFGQNVAEDMAKFQENWRQLAAKFDEEKGEFMSDLQRAADIAKEGEGVLGRISEMDLAEKAKDFGLKVAQGGLDAAKGTGKILSGLGALIPFVGKSKKKFDFNDKFEEEFQEVYEIMEAFPHLDRKLNEMEKLMKKVVDKNLEPIRKNALIIGQEQVVIIKRYNEYIEAIKELQNRYENDYLPVAQENADKGGNYQLGLKYVNDALGTLGARQLQLQSSQTQANTMTTNLEMMQDTVKNFISRARYYEKTAVPEFKMAMDTIRESIDLMKVGQKMADFENLGAKIYGAMTAVAKVTQSMDQKMSASAVDAEALEQMSREIAQLSVDREVHKQLQHQQNKAQAKMLEDASRHIDKAKQEVQNHLLVDGTKEANDDVPQTSSEVFKKNATAKKTQNAAEDAETDAAKAARAEKLEKLRQKRAGGTKPE